MRAVKTFIRPDDGEQFTLNEDRTTYSLEAMKQDFPHNLHMRWTAVQLRDAGMKEAELEEVK